MSSGAPRGEQSPTTGRILELPDEAHLPDLDRLLRLEGGSPEWDAPSVGLIVEDRLDGRRVYPTPPRRSRTENRLRRLLDRATPPMLPFVLLALAQAGTMLADAWSSGKWTTPDIADLALRLGYTSAVTLLPAGVLFWGSTARRSFIYVLGGAIAWSTLPAAAGLGWWFVRRSPSLMEQFGYAAAVGVAAAALIAAVGPALVAFGLERSRRSRMTPMEMAKRVATLTSLVGLTYLARWPVTDGPAIGEAAGGAALRLAETGAAAALPLELACLMILAYSCIEAIVVGETQGRFWQLSAAGATVLAAALIYRMMGGDLLETVMSRILTGSGWGSAPETAGMLAGGGLILLAFATPVWSAAWDAMGYGRGAPDDIFAWGNGAEPAGSEPIPMSVVVAVAAGADHALALDERGYVGAWGDDSLGQTDVPDGLSGVIALAAGDGFSLALRSDRTVAAWGANDLGQTNIPPGLAGVTAIAAGRGFALALMDDGTVVGWGDGRCGATPVPSWLSGVTAISAGEYHGLALLQDGAVVAWGDNTYGQLEIPARLGRATAISAGGDFCLALRTDGTVVAWGDNTYGQLEVPAGLARVTAISAGAFHAVALRADGDVVAWGGGQRQGEAEHPWRLVDFKAVAAGDGFSLAIRAA